MAWSIVTNTFVHSGTDRDFYQCPNTLPTEYAIRAQILDVAGNVKVLIRASGDGRTGIECGIEGADLIIREIKMGEAAAPLATIAHSIPSGETFTLRVQSTSTGIKVEAIRATGSPVSVTQTSEQFRNYRRWGFVSSVNNATVLWAWVVELTPIFADVTDVLGVVAGGDLWACYDGQTMELVGQRVMPETGQVSMDVSDGKVYMVGGGLAKVWDVTAKTVTNYTATGHATYKLPGATAVGTTKGSLLRTYRGGVCITSIEGEPNAIYRSAIGEPLTWNTAERAQGRAWVIGPNIERSGLSIADPVLALSVAADNVLLIGCTNSMLVLMGDPVDGAAELRPLSLSIGVSGPNAITLAESGLTVFHSPEGMHAVSAGDGVWSFSAGTLNNILTFARADRSLHQVTVVRDPDRGGLHIFLTKGAGAASTHFWYDEGIGKYRDGNGGFYPEQYPWTPTCATVWKGQVIIGTREGRLVQFDDTLNTDLGAAIDSVVSFNLIDEDPIDNDMLVDEILPMVSSQSSQFTISLYGARTPEDVYDSTQRTLLARAYGSGEIEPFRPNQRSAACLVVLRGPKIVLEAMEVRTRTARRIGRTRVLGALPVSTPCSPTAAAGTASPPGGGPGDDGSSPPPPPGPDGGDVVEE